MKFELCGAGALLLRLVALIGVAASFLIEVVPRGMLSLLMLAGSLRAAPSIMAAPSPTYMPGLSPA